MNEAPIERMRKLFSLAERGVGGEKDNAKRMLENLLAKHGMTEADLSGEQKPVWCRFDYTTKLDQRLLDQVLFKVLDVPKISYRSYRRMKAFEVEMTPAQRIECEVLLSIYRPALKKHMEGAFIAFLMKNRIHGESDSEESEDAPKKAEKPLAYDPKVVAAMIGATKVEPIHKQLGGA